MWKRRNVRDDLSYSTCGLLLEVLLVPSLGRTTSRRWYGPVTVVDTAWTICEFVTHFARPVPLVASDT